MKKETQNKSDSPFFKMTTHIRSNKTFLSLKWILGFLFIFFVIIFSINTPSKEQSPEKPMSSEKEELYGQSQLAANLQHLQQAIEASKKQLNQEISKEEQSVMHDSIDVARQNAPTLMYHLETSSPLSQTSNATFSGTGANESFANQSPDLSSVKAKKISHPETTLVAGEFIHAVLETAIQSDLPGLVRAIVTSPVYAYEGHTPLIPAGSRLMGQYASAIVQGQARVMVIWNRIVLPNGITVQLNSPGTDALGRAGETADRIDQHFMERFSQSVLLSLIGAGVSTIGVRTGDQQNAADAYRTAVADSFQASANDSLKQNEGIKPTLYVYQGQKINVFVAKDVSF